MFGSWDTCDAASLVTPLPPDFPTHDEGTLTGLALMLGKALCGLGDLAIGDVHALYVLHLRPVPL
eukprot:364339-Chlamydomonas_euryale.AAC.12